MYESSRHYNKIFMFVWTYLKVLFTYLIWLMPKTPDQPVLPEPEFEPVYELEVQEEITGKTTGVKFSNTCFN